MLTKLEIKKFLILQDNDRLEASIKGSGFIFNCVHLLYYKCYKRNFKLGGSYIDSPDWIKNKKATINPSNKKDKWFQDVVTVVKL